MKEEEQEEVENGEELFVTSSSFCISFLFPFYLFFSFVERRGENRKLLRKFTMNSKVVPLLYIIRLIDN